MIVTFGEIAMPPEHNKKKLVRLKRLLQTAEGNPFIYKGSPDAKVKQRAVFFFLEVYKKELSTLLGKQRKIFNAYANPDYWPVYCLTIDVIWSIYFYFIFKKQKGNV